MLPLSWVLRHARHLRIPVVVNALPRRAANYLEWATHAMNMWIEKGVTKEDFFKAMKSLKLMKGAIETIKELKKQGIKLAIISGSLDIILEKMLQ